VKIFLNCTSNNAANPHILSMIIYLLYRIPGTQWKTIVHDYAQLSVWMACKDYAKQQMWLVMNWWADTILSLGSFIPIKTQLFQCIISPEIDNQSTMLFISNLSSTWYALVSSGYKTTWLSWSLGIHLHRNLVRLLFAPLLASTQVTLSELHE
jgi:hypothetical protein